jgi:FMN phosphatase YigB (HAD superfamily)
MAKPDPAIYQLVLERLGTRPEETLFIDDKQANIDAARALGLVAIQFSTVEKLHDELIADGLNKDLPLPAPTAA